MASARAAQERGYDAHVLPDYSVQVDMKRRCTEVSTGFCKILGYEREELIGKRIDEITASRTNNVSVIFDLLLKNRYMHGIWIFLNRSGSAKILVRYEARLVSAFRIECTMELIGAGA